jgi:hypothetical protein
MNKRGICRDRSITGRHATSRHFMAAWPPGGNGTRSRQRARSSSDGGIANFLGGYHGSGGTRLVEFDAAAEDEKAGRLVDMKGGSRGSA